jgi:hypothetical protein
MVVMAADEDPGGRKNVLIRVSEKGITGSMPGDDNPPRSAIR